MTKPNKFLHAIIATVLFGVAVSIQSHVFSSVVGKSITTHTPSMVVIIINGIIVGLLYMSFVLIRAGVKKIKDVNKTLDKIGLEYNAINLMVDDLQAKLDEVKRQDEEDRMKF